MELRSGLNHEEKLINFSWKEVTSVKMIHGAELGILPGNNPFLVRTLKDVFYKLQGTQNLSLSLDPGEYHFYPQYGSAADLCISNHHKCDKRKVAFRLEHLEDFEINGAGSRFIFHTDILPFYINKSKNITLKNFTVDYAVPAYSEGTIVSINPQKMVMEIDSEKYKWQVKDNILYFFGENFCHPLHLCMEMDCVSGGPAYGTDDLYLCTPKQKAGLHPKIEKIDFDKVCFTLKGEEHFFPGSRAGNKLVLRHHPRSSPVFYASDSNDLSLEKITIHHAEGMGILAERCSDISLFKFNVIPDENNPRCFTASADAAHFVSCAGKIKLEGCRFEKQMDDGVNVHGFYSPIERQAGSRKLLLGWGHPEQRGVRMARAGDEAAIMDAKSLAPIWKGYFESVSVRENAVLAVFDRQLPEKLPENPVIENITLSPDVTIRKCEFRKNRARGVLLTCKKALVEDCVFETAGAAVFLEGEACSWYESGAVDSVVLKENRFINCAYIPAWGEAPVTVYPKVEGNGKEYYHKSLELLGNVFYCFDERILYARQIEHIIIMNNKYFKTKAYPEQNGRGFDIVGKAFKL